MLQFLSPHVARAGMILAPVVLNYLRVEMSKIEVAIIPALAQQPAVERIEPGGKRIT